MLTGKEFQVMRSWPNLCTVTAFLSGGTEEKSKNTARIDSVWAEIRIEVSRVRGWGASATLMLYASEIVTL
jgi:hypothetical protein